MTRIRLPGSRRIEPLRADRACPPYSVECHRIAWHRRARRAAKRAAIAVVEVLVRGSACR